ncbi:hypothetical protein C7460_104318 [Marinoscillum furvescens DSM 4134]|uniref:Uncharacterized protein n=1 Tax=Marinoscillum furvescens DSM 4134 TaxID=1122208 RepID=A0A3D9L8U3_MARFU|nr:hypothetical protein C7460_104318 [Marinoscillum furvescens DSM 4134]
MRIFLNEKHKWVSIIGLIISIPIFMALMPYGSFNPSDIGFWMSIGLALFIDIGTNFLLVKFQKK